MLSFQFRGSWKCFKAFTLLLSRFSRATLNLFIAPINKQGLLLFQIHIIMHFL